MVLSLTDHCLMVIRNGIENGIIKSIHQQLPPNLRQRVLDMILMHGTINKPTCLGVLGSPDFLHGLTSFNVQKGDVDDSNYLHRIAASMSKTLPNGTKIGAQFKEMKLNIYEYRPRQNRGNIREDSMNLQAVIALIAQCPNLSSLEFRMVDDDEHERSSNRSSSNFSHGNDQVVLPKLFSEDPKMAGLLNEFEALAPCLDILKSITTFKLKLSCRLWELPSMTNVEYAMLEFSRLTELDLKNVTVSPGAWLEFLRGCRQTLESFRLVQDATKYWETDFILPYPMPQLKLLELRHMVNCTRLFVKNLNDCPKLEHVSLEFDVSFTKDLRWYSLTDSIATNAVVEIKVDASVVMDESKDRDEIDSNSNFKMVNLCFERINSLSLTVWTKDCWNQKTVDAIAHAVNVCQNLESLNITVIENDPGDLMESLSSALAALLNDQRRSSQLRELDLCGNFEPYVYEAIFSNCLNLERLRLESSPSVNDLHLINWIRGGPKPLKHFAITGCKNVTSEGLIPVILNSKEHLKEFTVDYTGRLCMWSLLASNCRNLQAIYGCPERLIDRVKSKVFKSSVFIMS